MIRKSNATKYAIMHCIVWELYLRPYFMNLFTYWNTSIAIN